MTPVKKTWSEKLNPKAVYKVEKIDTAFADMPCGATMLVPTPLIVDEYIRAIPIGTSSSLSLMRTELAHRYGAEYTCPLTTGISIRICAEAAYERYLQADNTRGITPFWRIIDADSPVIKKLSFGEDFVIKMRNSEGLV